MARLTRQESTSELLRVDGTRERLPKGKLSLESLQSYVGGYIELVPIPLNTRVMVVNEEGLLRGLPFNRLASYMCCRRIVGDAVFMCRKDFA
jgi:hypothetical protein